MDIQDSYEIKIDKVWHFVYKGTCDGIPTKWVTKSEWDGEINVQMIDNRIKYTDTNGEEISVYDEEDIEYNII